jgi:hypothetical protein
MNIAWWHRFSAPTAWIEDYNTRRRHSSCQIVSPADYEKALAARKAARHAPALKNVPVISAVQVVPPRA